MPLEGHWNRQNTPLRRLNSRERTLAIVVAAAIAVSVAIGTFFVINDSPAAVGPGCIAVESGSTMGSGKISACGENARLLCRHYNARSDEGSAKFREACRTAGYGSN